MNSIGRVSNEWFHKPRHWTTAVVLSTLLVMLAPTAARAHGTLKSSTPAAGAHLGTMPRELRLLFTEAPALAFSRVELRGPDGAMIALGSLKTAVESRRTLVAAISGRLVAGTFTVVWQMAGDDGHPVRGRYTFTIAPGAQPAGEAASGGEPGAAVTAPGQSPPPASHHEATSMPEGLTFGAESPAYVAIRGLLFLGLLIAIGAIAFQGAVLGLLRRKRTADSPMTTRARHGAARAGLVSIALVGVAAMLRLIAQSYAMHGPADTFNAPLVGAMLRSTVWGWGWLLQITAMIVAAAGFRSALRGGGWSVARVGVAALAFTPALSGHAASAPQLTALAILADGLHVIGAGGWLGSLLLVLVVGLPAAMRLAEDDRGPAVADLIHAFSPTALAFAGISATTGVFAAWLHLGDVSALWQTDYGRTLLVKLAILSLVAGTGAYNWLRVKPTLGTATSVTRIRRSARIELVVGAFVIIVTSVLVATPTAMNARPMDTMDTRAAIPRSVPIRTR